MSNAIKKTLVKSFGKQSHEDQSDGYHHKNLDLGAFINQSLIDSVDCGPFKNEVTKPGSPEASTDYAYMSTNTLSQVGSATYRTTT